MADGKSLLVLGAGTHGRVVREIANACGYTVYFLDDCNTEAIGRLDQIENYANHFDGYIVGIGNNAIREKLTQRLHAYGCMIPTLVHPSAFISPSAVIGCGTVVAPHATINTGAIIGEGCIISIGGLIDHDAIIEDFVHVNAGAICKGGSHVPKLTKLDAGQITQGF